MKIFISSINQMAVLFSLIAAGYLLVKCKITDAGAASVLSKLENTILIPALVLRTFIKNFTVKSLGTLWKLFLGSAAIVLVMIPISILISRFCSKDRYMRKIFTYGLVFSNFGFMGNAVVSAIFPDVFFEYLVFTLPLWTAIYLWGAPALLMSDDNGKTSIKDSLKKLVNPMFAAMLIGMLIGVSGLTLPTWAEGAISAAADCMSPVAMILTGITVASVPLKKLFSDGRVYAVSIIRLVFIPLAFIGFFALVPCFETFVICAVCSAAMPLGLNTIVIPSAYGKDTTAAAGMAIVSHLLSCITIPVILMLMTEILK